VPDEQGFIRSEDGGKTWTTSNSGLPTETFDGKDSSLLLAGIDPAGATDYVHVSRDSGKSWEVLLTEGPDVYEGPVGLVPDPNHADQVFVLLGGFQLLQWSSSTSTWQPVARAGGSGMPSTTDSKTAKLQVVPGAHPTFIAASLDEGVLRYVLTD